MLLPIKTFIVDLSRFLTSKILVEEILNQQYFLLEELKNKTQILNPRQLCFQ